MPDYNEEEEPNWVPEYTKNPNDVRNLMNVGDDEYIAPRYMPYEYKQRLTPDEIPVMEDLQRNTDLDMRQYIRTPMDETRGFWEEPSRIARYKHVLDAAPTGWEAPDWLDAASVRNAYREMERKNDGEPWWKWKQPGQGDELSAQLRNMSAPPKEFLWDSEQAYGVDPNQLWYQTQNGLIVPNPTISPQEKTQQYLAQMGMDKVTWQEMPTWQRIMTTLTAPQPGAEGRPEASRYTAAGIQGAMGALPVLAVGATLGLGAPAVAAIGVPILLAGAYASYTGRYIPGLSEIMQVMNKPAEWTEQTIGLGVQVKADGLTKVLEDLPAAWSAAYMNYETANMDMLNSIARMAGDTPATEQEVWRFTEGYTDPTPLLNQARTGAGGRREEAMAEARERISGGEDAALVYADFYDRFGDTGTFNDFISQMIIDPLNIAPFVEGQLGSKIADMAGNKRLAAAFDASKGNILVDALPPGLQQLADIAGRKHGIHSSDGLISTYKRYGDWVKSGYFPEGTAIKRYDQLSWFDRKLGGLTDEGMIKELQPYEQNTPMQKLRHMRDLTPDAQASIFMQNAMDNIGALLLDSDSPDLDNMGRAQKMAALIQQTLNVDSVEVGQAGEALLGSPMTATTSAAFHDWIKTETLDNFLAEYAGDQQRIAMLENLSEMVGREPALLIKDLAENPRAVLSAIVDAAQKNSDNPNAAGIMADIQSGALTPELLADEMAVFTGKKGSETIPAHAWAFEDFRARVMNSLFDHVEDWTVKQFDLKPNSAFFRMSAVLKSAQSMLLLDLNPGYLVNNALNNWVTRAVDGVFGFMTEKQANDWIDRFGVNPSRLEIGVDAAGNTLDAGAHMGKIRDAVRGDGALTKLQRQMNKARNKFGLASKASGALEKAESRSAYTIGMQKAWDQLWKPGVGFEKMPSMLEVQLRNIDPGLPEKIYGAVRGNVNMNEINAALYEGAVKVNVSRLIDDAANQLAPDHPDTMREMLRTTGLEQELTNQLKNAETPRDVERAFSQIKRRQAEYVDMLKTQELVNAASEVAERVKAEGWPAAQEIFTDMQVKVEELWIRNLIENGELKRKTDLMDPAERNAVWRSFRADEQRRWNQMRDFELQATKGVLDAWGIDSEPARQYLEATGQRLRAWSDVYNGYDVDAATGARISPADAQAQGAKTRHVDGRNDMQRRYFNTDYPSKQARNTAYHTLQAQINELMQGAFGAEQAAQLQLDDMFARLWEQQSGQPGDTARAWRQNVMNIRDEMRMAMGAFQDDMLKRGDDLDLVTKRKMEQEFYEKTYQPMIARLKNEEIQGANGLGNQPPTPTGPEGTPPPAPMPEAVPVDPAAQAVATHADALDVIKKAEQGRVEAQTKYDAILNKKEVLSQMRRGMNLTAEETSALELAMDLHAERWGEESGKSADSWYAEHIGGILDKADTSEGLFQAADPTSSPEFKRWFGESKVLDYNGEPLEVYHGTTHDFTEFSDKNNNAENFAGKAYYFTDSEGDLNNYAGEGPDLTRRIEGVAERLADEILTDPYEYEDLINKYFPDRAKDILEGVEELDYNDLQQVAKDQLTENAGLAMPVYLDIEKPARLKTGDNDSYIRYEAEWEDNGLDPDDPDYNAYEYLEDEWFENEHGERFDMKEIIDDLARRYSWGDTDSKWSEFSEKLGFFEGEEFSVSSVKEAIDEVFLDVMDYDTDEPSSSGQVFREFLEEAGYDGIIMDAYKHFPNMPEVDGATHYIAFKPEQVKSRFNQGTWDAGDRNILHQVGNDKWYYSNLERTITDKMPNAASVEQIQGMLRGKVKADELKWTGLDDWLGEQTGKVSKQDVLLNFLQENQVEVVDVTHSSGNKNSEYAQLINTPNDEITPEISRRIAELENIESKDTKYQQYTLPGGENYKELLLTLPVKTKLSFDEFKAKRPNMREADARYNYDAYKKGTYALEGEEPKTLYRSSHWDEPNVLAHIRMDDRIDMDGKRVLFVEEIQSDWHQEGRTQGYRSADLSKTIEPNVALTRNLLAMLTEEQHAELKNISNTPFEAGELHADPLVIEYIADTINTQEAKDLAVTINKNADAYRDEVFGTSRKAPPAPFSKNWEELAIKRVIRYAAENGYDRVAWTPGEIQADRYNLANVIDRIDYEIESDFTVSTFAKEGGRIVHDALGTDPESLKGVYGVEISRKIAADVAAKKAEWQSDLDNYNDIKNRIQTAGADEYEPLGDELNRLNDKYNGDIERPEFESGEIIGDGLKVGGEGMKAFYDKKIPNIVKKYIKKWGGELGEAQLGSKSMSLEIKEQRLDSGAYRYNVDGHIFAARADAEAYVREYGPTVPSFDVTPEMRTSAMEGQPLFQGGEKGSVNFLEDGRAIIRATKAADISTAVHEVGHIFRRDLTGSDLEAVAQWGGLKDGAEYTRLQAEFDSGKISEANRSRYIDAEEKFARGFERYLSQDLNKSIPTQMAHVFKKFAGWLQNIYGKLKGSAIDVDIYTKVNVDGQDIRITDVFDRMLFDEESIARTRENYKNAEFAIERRLPANNPQDAAWMQAADWVMEQSTKRSRRPDGAIYIRDFFQTNIEGKQYTIETKALMELLGLEQVGQDHYKVKDFADLNSTQKRRLAKRVAAEYAPDMSNSDLWLLVDKYTGKNLSDIDSLDVVRQAFESKDTKVAEQVRLEKIAREESAQAEIAQRAEAMNDPAQSWKYQSLEKAGLPDRIQSAIKQAAVDLQTRMGEEFGSQKTYEVESNSAGQDFQSITGRTKSGRWTGLVEEIDRIYNGIDGKGHLTNTKSISDALQKIIDGTDKRQTKTLQAVKQYLEYAMQGNYEADNAVQGSFEYMWYTGNTDGAIRLYEQNANLVDFSSDAAIKSLFGDHKEFARFLDELGEWEKAHEADLQFMEGQRSQPARPYFETEYVTEPYQHGQYVIDQEMFDDSHKVIALIPAEPEGVPLYQDTVDTRQGRMQVLGIDPQDPDGFVYFTPDGEIRRSNDRTQLYQRGKKAAPGQASFFDQTNEDLPLFSGTAQGAQGESFTPKVNDTQGTLFDMRPEMKGAAEGGDVQARPGELFQADETPLMGQAPAGSTPAAMHMGDALGELADTHLMPMLDMMEQQAKDRIVNDKRFKMGDMDEQTQRQLQQWLKRGVENKMSSTKLATMRYGEQKRDSALLDYGRRFNVDNYLNVAFPYQLWYTRSMMGWAKRMIDKPAWFSNYARVRELQRKQEVKGVPSRLRGKVRTAAPYLPDWAGGTSYYDPLKQLFPFEQMLNQPLLEMQMDKSRQSQTAIEIMRGQMQSGQITQQEYDQAMETKDGYIWNRAWQQAGEETANDGAGNPFNMVNMMMGPAMYLTTPYNIAKGTPEKISPLPATRTASAIETVLKDTPLQFAGDLVGMIGAGPERAARKAAGISEFGEWGTYYVERQLSNMAAEGAPTEAIMQAMMEHSGQLWDEAYRRVQQEQALRVPGALQVEAMKGAARGQADALNVIGSLYAGLHPQTIIPEGELAQRGISAEYSKAWDEFNAGNRNALDEFTDAYPEYETRLALFDEPEERLRNHLVSEIWDKYSSLSGPNKKIAREQMGDAWQTAFYNQETRDYTAIDVPTLAYWANRLNGMVPRTDETAAGMDVPMYQQEAQMGGFYPQEDAAEVQTYWDEKSRLFPNINKIQDQYYDSGRDQKVLKTYPMLLDYWDWKTRYREAHPAVDAYLEEQSAKYNNDTSFGGERSALENSRQRMSLQEVQNLNPVLVSRLMGYYLAGQALDAGARARATAHMDRERKTRRHV